MIACTGSRCSHVQPCVDCRGCSGLVKAVVTVVPFMDQTKGIFFLEVSWWWWWAFTARGPNRLHTNCQHVTLVDDT